MTDDRTAPDRVASRGRITWLDNARGIGIVLVVLGHAVAPGYVRDILYAFHMPLFFFLAGVTATAAASTPWPRQVHRYAHSLLIPFAVFGLMSLACIELVALHRGAPPHWQSLLLGVGSIAYGVAEWMPVNSVLWFFPALFVTACGSLLLVKLVGRMWALTIAALAGTAVILLAPLLAPLPVRLPWSADSAVVASMFFLGGLQFGPPRKLPAAGHDSGTRRAVLAILSLLFLLTTAAIAKVNGFVNINELRFGNPLLYLLGSVLGTAGIIGLSVLLPASRGLRLLSRESRTIFPLHILVFSGVSMLVGAAAHWPNPEAVLRARGWIVPLHLVFGLTLPIVFAWIVRRRAAWLLGEGGPRRRPAASGPRLAWQH
ncbi:MAG: acyltransferase family protein [Paracraurococcus sp.]